MSRPRRAAWRGAPLPGLPRRSSAAARRDSPEFLGVRTVCARVCVCCGAGVWAEGRAAHVSRESRLGGRFPAPARPKAPGSMSQSKAGSRALCLPPAVPTPADRGGLEAGPRARWERRLRPPRGAVDPRVGEDGSTRVRSAERGGSWAASEPEPHTPARSGSPGGAGCPLRLGGTRGAGRGVSGVVYTAGPGCGSALRAAQGCRSGSRLRRRRERALLSPQGVGAPEPSCSQFSLYRAPCVSTPCRLLWG